MNIVDKINQILNEDMVEEANDKPSPKDTYNKIKGFDKTALQGFARKIDYPELSDFRKMDKEGIIEELIVFLHGSNGEKFMENPKNFSGVE